MSISTHSDRVTVNGIAVDPGPPIAGAAPSDGLCMVSPGETTLQACMDIFGEPSFEEQRGDTTVIAFNYASGTLLAFSFEEGILSNIVLAGSTSGLDCLLGQRDGGWYTRPTVNWRDAGAGSLDAGR